MHNTRRVRTLLSAGFLLLLLIAIVRVPRLPGQGAVPYSKPGQEELTFWVNHNGLEQLDALGEFGFGDMARILMRRRSNAPLMRELRDRFTFKVHDMRAVNTPDAYRVRATDSGLTWANAPQQFVIAASHNFNLPLIVENATASPVKLAAEFQATQMISLFKDATVDSNNAGGYFLRVIETGPGMKKGRLSVRAANHDLAADVTFDVRPLVRLRVKLLDEDGTPAMARVYLTAVDGLAYAPAGSINRYTAMSAEPYFDAEDSFAVDVPAGDTLIEATRGPEYEVTSRKVDAVKDAGPVTIQLKRWTNMAAKGWYSSDAHIHANYTADQHQVIDLHDIRLYVHAEDLNNANMLVANSSDAFIHDLQYFEGKPNSISAPGYVVYFNEEMRHRGLYGHMAFFGLKKLIYPLYTGFPNTPYPEDYPPNYTQADAAKKDNAAVDYVHPGMVPNFEELGGAGAHELPIDLALGKVDAMDVLSNNDEIASMTLWYRLLNCGFRLAISAGTDSFTNVTDHYTPGGGRVYVHSGSPLRYDAWVHEYQRGHSFASNGPVILYTVDGHEAGDDLRFAAGSKQTLHVKATMTTQVPVDKVEIVVNGKVVAARDATGKKQVILDEPVALEQSAWIAVRAIGPWHRLILNDIQTFAHTSPVYVHFGDQRVVFAEDAKFYDEWIGKLIAQVKDRGRFATPEHRDEVIALFRRAQDIYRELKP
jgi:TolB protein